MSADELMQHASACAAAGDLEGELAAYREADELGDAEAAIFLGNALRARGDVEAARAAYERAEDRGHTEAAMSLGNVLSDLGDRDGAEAAYLRSIALGSTIASVNLGLMLMDAGETEKALPHLERAADAGDAIAHWAIGKALEGRREWAAAADAFRQGADLLHAPSAWGLGYALSRVGDLEAAEAAFAFAAELGHRPALGELWANTSGAYDALGSQRQMLGRYWIEATLTVQEKQAQLAVLRHAEGENRTHLENLSRQFSIEPHRGQGQGPMSPGATDWLTADPERTGSWCLAPQHVSAFAEDLEAARVTLVRASNATLKGGLKRKGAERLGRVLHRLDGLKAAMDAATQAISDAERSRESDCRSRADAVRDELAQLCTIAKASQRLLPAVLQPWSSPSWETWSFEDTMSLGLRFAYGGTLTPKPDARLGTNADHGTDLRTPWAFTLHDNWWIRHDGSHRGAAHAFVRSMMLRQLMTCQPGDVRFLIFDPVGLGQSAGDLLDLAEYDADLIGGKVWSSSQDLEARLVELSAHIELVIQKYLRTTYKTIDDFNDAAGEISEPYRMLILFDVPVGLTGEAATRLKSIVENGPRCGVFTLIASDAATQVPYGVDVDALSAPLRHLNLQADFADDLDGYKVEASFEPDVLPDQSDVAKRVIDAIGRASIARTETAVTFDKAFAIYGDVAARGLRPELGTAPTRTRPGEPDTWWTDSSTRGLYAPIGQKGARDVAVLGFNSNDQAGALLVGRPGSGKSTLLHAYIGGLTLLYGPDELDLYLIDFKEGVEFKAYGEEKLPHAKVIAVESDREFGLSVLQSLQAEIASRAELLRATGGSQAGLQAYREATGETIPRILLVFDEFQVLFAQNDKLGLAAADLLESIIRQGRGFGVHVLLGSQSLSGMDALGAHVPQLLPVRILLPASDTDARRVLGDTNNAGDYLTSHGEGILNAAGGADEANERFKGSLLTEADRIARVRTMRSKADSLGFTRAPMVFEGNALLDPADQEPGQFREEMAASGANPMRLRVGKAMTVGALGDLTLARESGANVLAILRSGQTDGGDLEPAQGPALGLLASAVASAAMTDANVDVVAFTPIDDGLDELFEPLLDAGRISMKRRRAFPDVLSAYATEVGDRVDQDDARRPAKLLFLFGVHRARDLDAEMGSLDADLELSEKLESVMRDGPEVGVHVWLWSDGVAGVSRRLSARMMREVSWRIAGKMSGDDSHTFIGSGQAAELRESQLLLVNDERSISTRLTAYSPPSRQWLTDVLTATKTE